MTPLLPNPDYYIANLITMTSSEATRLWRRAIKESFDCTCVYCGKTYDLHDLTIDHVHPRSRGGETISSNCVPACTCCNQDKGSEHWQEWMRAKHGLHPDREQKIINLIHA
jgi:5-methylcytosine-specific restriction endonuclease McrA